MSELVKGCTVEVVKENIVCATSDKYETYKDDIEGRPRLPKIPPEFKYSGSISGTALPCCSMHQLNLGGYPTASIIRDQMIALSEPNNHGRRVFMAIVIVPTEEYIAEVLLHLGFVEVADFSRRTRYDQEYRLRMFLHEPELDSTGHIVVYKKNVIKNVIRLPKQIN
jgi:hypothetical protein